MEEIIDYFSETDWSQSNEEEIFEEESISETSNFLLNRNTDSFKCLAQIQISRSSIFRDPFYHFPEIEDPHLDEALWGTEKSIVYEDDGYELYKHLCESEEMVTFRRVLNSLHEQVLDLKFYGLSLKAMSAICKALESNRYVQQLKLDENILKPETLQCLANLIEKNKTITRLGLKRCHIGKLGAALLTECFLWNKSITDLDLSYNSLGDEGMEKLARGLMDNTSIKRLNLSHNNLGERALKAFRPVIEENYFIIYLDLSYNDIFTSNAMENLMKGLAENIGLKSLNLSHNGIGDKETFRHLMVYLKAEYAHLQHLNLSHNRITGVAIRMLKAGLRANESLVTLDLSYNPITADEIEFLCDLFLEEREAPLTLMVLDFGKTWVKKNFIPKRNKILKIGCKIIFGGIYSNFKINGPNVKEMLLERATYVLGPMQAEKRRKEFAPFIMALPNRALDKDDFIHLLKKKKIKLGRDLQQMIIRVWHDQNKQVDILGMKEVCMKVYPDTEIPEKVIDIKKKKKKKRRKKKAKKEK